MEKHFDNIIKLVDESLIVKIVAPSSYGKTTLLPFKLTEKYDLKVIVANENISKSLNSLNNIYISSKLFLKEISKPNFKYPSLLIIDEMDTGSLENFLIISLWKKTKTNTKLILLSSLPHNLFPEFPTYQITSNKKSDIRYCNKECIDLVYKVHNSNVNGDFLIFTIFLSETIDKLKKMNMKDVEIYSSENIDSKMYIQNGKRKIIVASDLAKTSLTLNTISVIFDTMLERRLVPTVTGGAKIRTMYISKRDAELRARNNCIVYRFISEREFHNLDEFTEEIIFRIPLHHLMLDIYKYKLNPFELLGFEKNRMNWILNLFLEYDIIDFNNRLTKRGEMLRKMPFGLRNSLLCLKDLSYGSVVLASCIENYTKYVVPLETDKEFEVDYEIDSLKHFRTYFERFRGFTDAETVLNIFSISQNEINLENWCKENYIIYEFLKNVHSSVEKVCKILNIEKVEFEVINFLISIENLVKKLYSDKKLLLNQIESLYTLYTDEKGEVYNIDPSSINLISIQKPLVIYGLILSEFQETKSVSFSF